MLIIVTLGVKMISFVLFLTLLCSPCESSQLSCATLSPPLSLAPAPNTHTCNQLAHQPWSIIVSTTSRYLSCSFLVTTCRFVSSFSMVFMLFFLCPVWFVVWFLFPWTLQLLYVGFILLLLNASSHKQCLCLLHLGTHHSTYHDSNN